MAGPLTWLRPPGTWPGQDTSMQDMVTMPVAFSVEEDFGTGTDPMIHGRSMPGGSRGVRSYGTTREIDT